MRRKYQVSYYVTYEVDVNIDDINEEVGEEEIEAVVAPYLPTHPTVVDINLDSIESLGELFLEES